jgi:hypothetical protein
MKSALTAILALSVFCGLGRAENLITKPLVIFSKTYAEIAPHFERAKIETNWAGFFIRADTYHFFKQNDSIPSEYGIWIGVRTLPVQDLKSASEIQPTNDYIQKVTSLKFPKQKDDEDSGLLIVLRYGAQCDKKVITELLNAIDLVKKAAEQGAAANP